MIFLSKRIINCAKIIQINRCINRQKSISCVEVIFRYWNLIPNAEVSICFYFHPCFFPSRKRERRSERERNLVSFFLGNKSVCVHSKVCVHKRKDKVCVRAPIKLKTLSLQKNNFGAFKTTPKRTIFGVKQLRKNILKFKSRSKVCVHSKTISLQKNNFWCVQNIFENFFWSSNSSIGVSK